MLPPCGDMLHGGYYFCAWAILRSELCRAALVFPAIPSYNEPYSYGYSMKFQQEGTVSICRKRKNLLWAA